MNNIKTVGKNFFSLASGRAAVFVINAIWIIVFIRYLGSENYGKFSLAMTIAALLGIFLDFGFNVVHIREVSADNKLANNYYSNVNSLRFFIGLMVCSIAIIIGLFFSYPSDLFWTLVLMTVNIVIWYLAATGFEFLRALQDMKYEAMAEPISRLSVVLLGLGCIWLNKDIVWFAFANVIGSVVFLLFSVRMALKKKIKIFSPVDFSFMMQFVKNAFFIGLGGLGFLIYNKIDVVMINGFLDYKAVGMYNCAYRFIDISSIIQLTFYGSVFPLIAKTIKSGNLMYLNKLINQCCRFMAFVAMCIVAYILIFGEDLIDILFTVEFSESHQVLNILIFSTFILFVGNAFGNILVCTRRVRYYAYLSIGGAITNILLNLIAIPYMGILGAALTSVVTFLITTIVAFYAVKDYINKFSFRSTIIIPCLIGFLSMAIFYFTALKHVSFWSGSVLFLVLYLSLFLIFRGIKKEELAFGWGLLQKKEN
ncbi:MAG: flippase [Candidatus Omnitrophica bacterium]|nr:flippase [Candidatus Omnitrophota bacterium]